MFDLGDISSLPSREILKLTHIFVTHTHMDHFMGFDTLLKTHLGRAKTLHLFGPSSFSIQVEGKLSGYTWNLVSEYEKELRLCVNEVLSDRILTKVYNCRERFAKQETETEKPFNGLILKEPSFSIWAELLDHRIPCLALSLQENRHVNIIKEKLKELELPVGPWINRFKSSVHEKVSPESEFTISWESNGKLNIRTYTLSDLAEMIAVITKGQKLVYITDAVASPENRQKIIRLANDCDIMFIEAPFMHRDREIAAKKFHLTAREAGELAGRAGAKSLRLFHFSPRYHGNGHELEKEAKEAYLSSLGGKHA